MLSALRNLVQSGARHRLAALVPAAFAVLGTSCAQAARIDCAAQTQLDVGTIDRQIVLVGEPHGTKEIPRFVAGLVCGLLKHGKSVILAIEHNGEEQASLNRYLASRGADSDRRALLSAPSWHARCQDGRYSAAMFDLIESMRQLRQAGQRVGVLAAGRHEDLDVPMTEAERAPLTPQDNALQSRGFDRMLADEIVLAAVLYRGYTVVVLTGAGHAAIHRGGGADPLFVPMGALVDAQIPAFFVDVETEGGTAWRAGPQGCKAQPVAAGRTLDGSRVDASVGLGRLTPSPPAVPR